jgi:hypothetical protein
MSSKTVKLLSAAAIEYRVVDAAALAAALASFEVGKVSWEAN